MTVAPDQAAQGLSEGSNRAGHDLTLRELRQLRDLSIRDVERRVGINRARLSMIERGLEYPSNTVPRGPRIFVNSLSDLFHEELTDDFIARVFATMAALPDRTFQVLTKRPRRMLEWFGGSEPRRLPTYLVDLHERIVQPWPLPNVWLGVSIENARYTWRADVLRDIPAAVRFISAEPLLGSLLPERCGHATFPEHGGSYVCGRVKGHAERHASRFDDGAEWDERTIWHRHPDSHWSRPLDLSGIDWLIVGGESGGRQARPMHPDWARELRDACMDRLSLADARQDGYSQRPAFFFKQWGSWTPNRPDGFGGVASAERARRIQSFEPDGTPYDRRGSDSWARSTTMYYAGARAKSGGRELDGREWDEMPSALALPGEKGVLGWAT